MTHFITVTDAELARARDDPTYRQQLLAANLEQLLTELSRHQRTGAAGGKLTSQLREGSLLAVKLAGIISRLDRRQRT
jgi:hypothetical protein